MRDYFSNTSVISLDQLICGLENNNVEVDRNKPLCEMSEVEILARHYILWNYILNKFDITLNFHKHSYFKYYIHDNIPDAECYLCYYYHTQDSCEKCPMAKYLTVCNDTPSHYGI